ncbi:MAG TPA: peptide chain release factor N(5)-glutamine methyltransferase [Hyphomonadaceae bacterium]|nr:peptide chain release factor N(5)-glutamine methyltransferase [Hyphomonadaceae bacterium]
MNLNCTWRDMMREAAGRLAEAGIEHPLRDVRLLMAHAMGVEPVEVILRETDAVDPATLTEFEQAVARRLNGEPVSRIRGRREFYGRTFLVTPAVLDPRPETELLVSEGVKRLPRGGRVLDLGTGSGCILLSVLAERDDVTGVGLDLSPDALGVARRNAERLAVQDRATLVEGSWDYRFGGAFDLAVSNPPYLAEREFAGLDREVREHDPRLALVSGKDGLEAYRAILAAMPGWLKPGGAIGFEFGSTQGEAVSQLMAGAGLTGVEMLQDLAGHTRAAFGRRPL